MGRVGEVAVEDVIAGVAAVVSAGRTVIVVPGLTESRPQVVLTPAAFRHHSQARKHVDSCCHSRCRGAGIGFSGAGDHLYGDDDGHDSERRKPEHPTALHDLSRYSTRSPPVN